MLRNINADFKKKVVDRSFLSSFPLVRLILGRHSFATFIGRYLFPSHTGVLFQGLRSVFPLLPLFLTMLTSCLASHHSPTNLQLDVLQSPGPISYPTIKHFLHQVFIRLSPRQNKLGIEEGRGDSERSSTGRSVSITELAATDPLHRPMTVTIETLPDHPLVFASSRRLNLGILCTNTRPLREILDIWLSLPIIIWCEEPCATERLPMVGAENIISALGHCDRVSQISFSNLPLSIFSRFAAMMHTSFPALTHLELEPKDGQEPILRDSFLGGSAPCLRSLRLRSITFPALHKLLLSANDLVDLRLLNIPFSGYISPEEMASRLSSLTKLEDLRLGLPFLSPSIDPRSEPTSASDTRRPSLSHSL